MPAAATAALQNLGAFVLGHHALDLEQQIVLRRIADGPVQKNDVDAGAAQFVDKQRLMGVAPRQAIEA
jgi:hypothetical protein